MHQVPLYIGGEMRQSTSSQWLDVLNPANQEVLAQVPLATEDEVNEAIASAKEAFKTWKDVPVTERARIMMRYAQLLKEHHDEIATIICHELGKLLKMPKATFGVVLRLLSKANAPSNMMGRRFLTLPAILIPIH